MQTPQMQKQAPRLLPPALMRLRRQRRYLPLRPPIVPVPPRHRRLNKGPVIRVLRHIEAPALGRPTAAKRGRRHEGLLTVTRLIVRPGPQTVGRLVPAPASPDPLRLARLP